MKTYSNGDLKIIGDNNASGGKYNNAKIIGDGVVEGNLECLNFKCVGNTRVDGNVRADHAKIVGSLSVSGSLESEEIRIAGNVDTNGDVKSKSLVLRGGMEIKGGVKGEDVRLVGYTIIRKNCEVETFRSEGPLTISGMLNADDVDIRTHGRCKVTEIGGERIQARRGHYSKLGDLLKAFFLPGDMFKGKLVADSIEGDEVRLEDTKAKVVRGKNVIIGEGCEIDSVEYSEECIINHRSIVKEKKRISAR